MKHRGGIGQDLIFIGVFIIALVMFTLVNSYVTTTTTNACLSAATSIGANSNSTIACQQTAVAATNFGNTVPLIIGVLGIGAILSAAFLPVPVIFLPVGIFMLLVATIIFYNIQLKMPDVFGNSFFTSLVSQFPLAVAIANNIGWIIFVIGLAIIVVTYSRIRGGGTEI